MNMQAIAETEAVPPKDGLELSMTLAMALNKLPPLSPLVPKVLALRRDADAGITELARVISSDPTLSARMIGMANSAQFAGVHPLMRIQDALMRLGFVAACDMVVSVAVSRSLPTLPEFKPARRDLWLHSLAVGLCAREFARRMNAECDPDAAYLAGFLHDIGYLAIISLWPDMARKLIAHVTDPDRWDHPDFVREQGWPTHGALGGELCKLWRLPDEIWIAIWDHDKTGTDATMLGTLDGAIALAHRAVDGVLPLKNAVIWRPTHALAPLLDLTGLQPAVLDEVRSQLENQVERMAAVADSI
jgi:HD-like signal output (HDOD) protein